MKNFRASIMVGAGFSRNAEKNTPADKKFLDWNSLRGRLIEEDS
ncbi:MAG: hypothetical protein ACI4EA_05225 [Candidatus Ornithomonoglobus sp.]